jgi:hypothetical protein
MLIGVAIVEFSQLRQSDSCNKRRDFIFAQICVDSLCAVRDYQSVVAIILLLSVVDSVQSIQKTAGWRLMHTASSWSQAVREGEGTPHAARRGFSAKRHRRVVSLTYSTGKGTAGTSSFQDLTPMHSWVPLFAGSRGTSRRWRLSLVHSHHIAQKIT